MPAAHRRVLQLIADCGTGRLGTVSYRCAQCQAEGRPAVHHTNASCGNRHCPNCQTAKNGEWCLEQTKKLLPCEYYFVTFTIPSQLRRFVRSNQRLCYAAMFDAVAFALRTALAKPKYCGADQIGFTSVLHTFGRDMSYHPHIHVIVPSGGLRDDKWHSTRPGFFVPVKLLSVLFRIEFERLLREQIDPSLVPAAAEFRRKFVSDSKAVGDGLATLKYLSRYTFRTAITNDRIVSLANGMVTFSYVRSGEQHERQMTLSAFKFLHRFLQHVLPRRMHKIRHYGFLSRHSRLQIDQVREAILDSLKSVEPDLELEDWVPPNLREDRDSSSNSSGPTCPACGGQLVFERFHRIRPPPLIEQNGRSSDTMQLVSNSAKHELA